MFDDVLQRRMKFVEHPGSEKKRKQAREATRRKKRLSRPFHEISGLTCLGSGSWHLDSWQFYEVDRVMQGIGWLGGGAITSRLQ